MKHIELFEGFIGKGENDLSESRWVSLQGMSEDEQNELMDLLDELGVDFEDPGLTSGARFEVHGEVTEDQLAAIRAKFPRAASQIED
jgi:hypothetical protein